MQMCRVFRQVAGAQGGDNELDTKEVFKHAYDLGALLMSKHAIAGGVLPSELDQHTAAGHLMRICLEQQRLSEAPAATSSDAAGVHSLCSPHVDLCIYSILHIALRLDSESDLGLGSNFS